VQLATALRSRGQEVTVCARKWQSTAADEGIAFKQYKTWDLSTLTHLATEPWALGRMFRKELKHYDVGVCVGMPCLAPIVLVGPGTHRGWYETSKSKSGGGTGLRRIIERFRPFHWVVMLWERAMLMGRYPRLVVVPSETGVKEYRSYFDFPEDRIVVLPNAVEIEDFRFSTGLRDSTRAGLGLQPSDIMMLHIGNRGRQKGLDVLAAALRRLDPGTWQFFFAGSGSESRKLRRDVEGLANVTLLGRVPDTHAMYCAADLLVFPSRFDPWGLVVTEALATGLPVLASGHIGSAVAVKEGRNGWLIDDPTDVDELVDKIAKAIPLARSFDRGEIAKSVAWLVHFAQVEALEEVLKRGICT
jgi:UDP-glucose:(heptosyl)LPS alpha-1,3-glucosyltransferase